MCYADRQQLFYFLSDFFMLSEVTRMIVAFLYSQFGFIQIPGKTRPIPRMPKGKLELSALVSFSFKQAPKAGGCAS